VMVVGYFEISGPEINSATQKQPPFHRLGFLPHRHSMESLSR
jgi:hypothetical protein